MARELNKTRVAVIGSGFGGLAVAARLVGQGFDVTVVEKRDKPGGRAYVYEKNGFTFDAGPTVITAPECLEEVFNSAGAKMSDYVELLPVSPLYRLKWEDGYSFDYSNVLSDTLEQIERKSPRDVEGYRQFLQYTQEVFEEGYTKLAHVPFLDVASMIRVAPKLARLKAYRSVYSQVSRFLEDRHLREAFSFHSLLVGGNPFRASSIYTLIHYLERKWGVYFPRGGTGALVRALVRLIEERGGRFVYNREVRQISVRGGRVAGLEYADGKSEAFDWVVSNADVCRTYTRLLRAAPEASLSRSYVANARYSMSLFVLYFGTNRRYATTAHHTVLFGKRYKELLEDIFEAGVLADDFSLYLHAPTATDPSLAPSGCEAFYVLSPVPHLGKAAIDWKEVGPKYAARILKYLEERELPDLRRHLVTQHHFTPQDFDSELGAHLGSAFSLEPVLRQSAYFRIHNRDPRIRGLYFVGAGTHPGAGIPGVIQSAKATASLILEDATQWSRDRVVSALGDRALLKSAEKRIRVGSLSFSLAAKIFPRHLRDAAHLLYLWCRHVDDAVDSAVTIRASGSAGMSAADKSAAGTSVANASTADTSTADTSAVLRQLEALIQATRDATQVSSAPLERPFEAVKILSAEYHIPSFYFLELLEGMRMDAEGFKYKTDEDLTLYAYRVAGCVGLMMSHIMRVSSSSALKHACDLGMAMQLTNIARDVAEDYERGRVYFPKKRLDEVGISSEELLAPSQRSKLVALVEQLLLEADVRYASGLEGLKYLPLRAACAVGAAAAVYREIGQRVRARGQDAWQTRTVVGPVRKAWAVLCGVAAALRTVPERLQHPWRPISHLPILRSSSWN